MMELHFKNLHANVVSRPRTSSFLVELSLGALFLHDKLTPGTLFPVLIGPPGQDRLNQLAKSINPSLPRTASGGESFFYLLYESRPQKSASDVR